MTKEKICPHWYSVAEVYFDKSTMDVCRNVSTAARDPDREGKKDCRS